MADKNIGSLSLFLINPKNIEYVEFINKRIPKEALILKNSEKVYYLVNDIKNPLLCDCGEHRSFIGFKNGYRITCGKKDCFTKKRKETCIEKWGVDNPKKSKEILQKEKDNIKRNWNGEHYMKNKKIQDKFKNTMLNNWGVEWPQQSKEISNKSIETWKNNENKSQIIENRKLSLINKTDLEKEKINKKKLKTIEKNWGSIDEFISYRLAAIKEKSKQNWNCDHHLMNEEVQKKRVESYKSNTINKIKDGLPENISFIDKRYNENLTDSILQLECNKCHSKFEINRQLFFFRKDSKTEICLICNPISVGKSKREIEVYDFIRNNYDGKILANTQNIINKELDIWIPDMNLAFEFNGLYWHSEQYKDRKYHVNKTKECSDKGISLIHIWEDDWDYKNEIVRSIILNKIGLSQKIAARKCKIIEITDNLTVKNFLNKNHIQGFVGSSIKIGLYYENQLVSLMTFGNLRKSLGHKSKVGSWELLRFCNKLNTSVVGGSSKLFNYFINKYKPTEIISYSDNSRGVGNMYNILGFESIHQTEPNYYWIIDGIRRHRFNFRKDLLLRQGFPSDKTEIEIMRERGFFRIFDCGSTKWSFSSE